MRFFIENVKKCDWIEFCFSSGEIQSQDDIRKWLSLSRDVCAKLKIDFLTNSVRGLWDREKIPGSMVQRWSLKITFSFRFPWDFKRIFVRSRILKYRLLTECTKLHEYCGYRCTHPCCCTYNTPWKCCRSLFSLDKTFRRLQFPVHPNMRSCENISRLRPLQEL